MVSGTNPTLINIVKATVWLPRLKRMLARLDRGADPWLPARVMALWRLRSKRPGGNASLEVDGGRDYHGFAVDVVEGRFVVFGTQLRPHRFTPASSTWARFPAAGGRGGRHVLVLATVEGLLSSCGAFPKPTNSRTFSVRRAGALVAPP